MVKQGKTCLLVWGLVAALLSLNVVSSSLKDEKNFYFPPFPSFGSPPIALTPPVDPSSPPFSFLHTPPPTHTSPPVYHSSPPPVYHTSPPVYHTPSPPTHGSSPPYHHTPSHGGGGGGHHHRGSPPANCGTPPSHHTPSPGGHHTPSPATPTYHYSPPPRGGGSTPSPIVLPPITPSLPFPSPPFDPNSPPIGGTCDYWRNHPSVIWGMFGWFGTTIGSAFGITSLPGAGTTLPGTGATLPGAGASLNLVQALSNTRTDGFGALYREGTASLLNSMVNKNFPYTTSHVKDSFVAAVGSNKAAAAQARVFKLANEGHMKLRD